MIVSGLPASGKSETGRALASALALHFLDKDEILESMFDAIGVGDRAWRSKLSHMADERLREEALQTSGAVLTSGWRHPRSRVDSGTPTDWLRTLPGQVCEVYCSCPPQVAVERFFGRRRHAGHLDEARHFATELKKFEQLSALGPLGLWPLVEVNTQQPLDAAILLSDVTAALAVRGHST